MPYSLPKKETMKEKKEESIIIIIIRSQCLSPHNFVTTPKLESMYVSNGPHHFSTAIHPSVSPTIFVSIDHSSLLISSIISSHLMDSIDRSFHRILQPPIRHMHSLPDIGSVGETPPGKVEIALSCSSGTLSNKSDYYQKSGILGSSQSCLFVVPLVLLPSIHTCIWYHTTLLWPVSLYHGCRCALSVSGLGSRLVFFFFLSQCRPSSSYIGSMEFDVFA